MRLARAGGLEILGRSRRGAWCGRNHVELDHASLSSLACASALWAVSCQEPSCGRSGSDVCAGTQLSEPRAATTPTSKLPETRAACQVIESSGDPWGSWSLRQDGEPGDGGADPTGEPSAGRLLGAGTELSAGAAADCRGGRPERRQKLGARELRGQVSALGARWGRGRGGAPAPGRWNVVRCGEPEGGLEAVANWRQSSSVPGAGGVLPALGILRPRILHPVVTPCLPFILLYKAISSPPLVGESGSAPGSTSLAGKPLAAWMRSSVLSSPLVSSSVSTTSSFSCHPPRSFQLCCGDLPLLLCSFPLALALQFLYCLRQSSPAPSWGGGVCGPRNPGGECLSGDACLLFVRPGSRRINGGVFERAPIHCSDMTDLRG